MREKIDLNGIWDFQIDPLNEGEFSGWAEGGVPEPRVVEVPHIWQREGADLLNYNGLAWYVKRFGFSRDSNRVFLLFGAVDYQARVWLNGQFVGEHEGGFTPFEFDVTELIHTDKENVLAVRVYDPEDNAEIPIGKQGSWYTRVSGIWQSVLLEKRPETFISKVKVTPDIGSKQIKVEFSIDGDFADQRGIEFRVRNHLEEKAIVLKRMTVASRGRQSQVIDLPDPVLWEPECPHLYDLDVRLEGTGFADVQTATFGMRKVEYKDGMVLLNERPVYIRGALDQAFYPDTVYVAPSEDYIKNEITLAKKMGFNLLRKHIKVEIPQYLYWADRMGMLIWAEPPNYVKFTQQARTRFQDEMTAMMERDYNHPSIIIWSIYNEEWGLEWDLRNDPVKQQHVDEMYDYVKQLDTSRLICDNSGWTHVKTDINDHHRYFVCPDQLEAWEEDLDEFVIGNPDANFVDGYHSNGEPIIVSEFGVWGLPSLEKLKEHYGGEPWWFINQGEESHQEDYKKPTTGMVNFAKYRLDEIFGSFENLAIASQKRMFRAVKSVIEEMRKRPAIAGYVVTEFTDIEWETNGWLDYLRNPKEGFEELVNFNGPIAVMADSLNHNLWSGDNETFDLIISNNARKSFSASLDWSIPGTEASGTFEVNSTGETFLELKNAVSFSVPEVKQSGSYVLKLALASEGELIAENHEELTITPKVKKEHGIISVYSMPDAFKRQLEMNGYELEEASMSLDVVTVTDRLDKEILKFIHDGGKVVFLAEDGDHIDNKGQFTFRELPAGESWPRASSFNFVNTAKFSGVPLQPEMGWEVDRLIPDYVVPFSDYKKTASRRTINMYGNSSLADSAEIVSGYFQGWIGQVGGSMVVQNIGKGTVSLTTWKLKETYGLHPIATQVFDKLVTNLAVSANSIRTATI